MSEENGAKKIRLWILIAGFSMGVLATLATTFITVGQDKGQLNINSAQITANTLAIRNLEQAYASQSTQLRTLNEQNSEMNRKLNRVVELLVNHGRTTNPD